MGTFAGIELTDLELAGPRLLLRRWRPDDALRVHRVMQDARLRRWIGVPSPYLEQDAADFVTAIGNAGRTDGSALGAALVERTSGRLVGSAELRLGEAAGAEIGYWVAADAWGAGYAAEACRTLAGWAFERGVGRVRILCDVRNVASAKTALNAGFAFEGVARQGLAHPARERVPELRTDLAMFARLPADPPGAVAAAFAPVPPGGLSDGVLRLRPAGAEDAPAMAETDDELSLRWGFTGTAHPAEEVRRQCEQAGLRWLVGSVALFAMIDDSSGRVAGSLRLRLAGPPQVGGLGYAVHPEFRGRRYTTRALRLLVPWAFGRAGFARLELGAKVGNEASIRAAAAAGFQPDGVRAGRLRNPDGSFSDEVRLCLVNPAVRRVPADGGPADR